LAIPTAEPTAERIKPHLELNFDESPIKSSLQNGLFTITGLHQQVFKNKLTQKGFKFFYIRAARRSPLVLPRPILLTKEAAFC
jgi:hypothetical protein